LVNASPKPPTTPTSGPTSPRAKIEGYVRKVAVSDFQRVKVGDLLVLIEDDNYRARVGQAEAAVAGAKAAIENLKAHKSLQHAEIAQAENAVLAIQADVERTTEITCTPGPTYWPARTPRSPTIPSIGAAISA
jgi:multidrug efflux pump subunit AcrA (membrane-fusion protein)